MDYDIELGIYISRLVHAEFARLPRISPWSRKHRSGPTDRTVSKAIEISQGIDPYVLKDSARSGFESAMREVARRNERLMQAIRKLATDVGKSAADVRGCLSITPKGVAEVRIHATPHLVRLMEARARKAYRQEYIV